MAKDKTLTERRKEAARIVEQIDAELSLAKKGVQECINELNEATKSKNDFRKLLPQINRLTNSVNTAITKIRSDRDRLSRLLTTVNNFHNKKFTPLQAKINDPETGLNARIKEGDKFSKELEKVKLNNQKQLKLITDLTSDFRKKLSELRSIETSLRKIQTKVLDEEKTVTQKRAKIQEDAIKVEAATRNIVDSEKIIVETEFKIQKLHKDSEKAYSQIDAWHTEADETLEKIRGIYEIAARTGLGGEFDQKRIRLDKDLDRWRKHLFFTTIGLFTVIIGLFILQLIPVKWDVTSIEFDGNFYARFLITSPFIFYLFFVTSQFNRTKSLLEKYSFKTALALSIEAHINLLMSVEEFQEKERLDKIADFILDGFNRIYDAPFEQKSDKTMDTSISDLVGLIKKELKSAKESVGKA